MNWQETLRLALEEMGPALQAAVERHAKRLGVSPQTIIQRAIERGLSRLETEAKFHRKRVR